jgi:glycosyltransferase involved in cell wall biosynthesis
MRIVVFSDLYPPLFLGGYEIGAALVVEELKRRGHEVLLLSSRDYFLQESAGFRYACHPRCCPVVDTGLCVFGSLPGLLRRHPLRFLRKVAGTWLARRRYRRAVAAFRPQRVLLFNPLAVVAPVLHDLAELAHQTGAEVHAYLSDDWLARWPVVHPLLRPLDRMKQAPRVWKRGVGKALSTMLGWTGWAPPGRPRIDRFRYCSDHLRRLTLRALGPTLEGEHDVVPWGLAGLEQLPQPSRAHFRDQAPLTIQFAGQIEEHKGLAVLLQALALCRRPHRLVVHGDDTTPCARTCKALVCELSLTARVSFLGKKSHAETLAQIGRLGQVLAVPSTWDEPFGLVVLEGMASGLPVVASNSGGPAEIIRPGETGFLFERGNPSALTAVLDRLEDDRSLCEQIGRRAREAVLREYTIERMVDRLLD